MIRLTEIAVILVFFVFGTAVIAQENKADIINNFNTIEYYPDSTIKAAYNLRRGKYRGYAVEFDSIGNPEWIGKYRNGLKQGTWKKNDSSARIYKRGEWDYAFRPGCGTGRAKSKEKFYALYARLTQ